MAERGSRASRFAQNTEGDTFAIKHTATALALLASTMLGTAMADMPDHKGDDHDRRPEAATPHGIPQLDHVFVIMMENHGYDQVIGNPSAPFINAEAASANLATNYFGVGHPSLTNYLETVGGSNFGIRNDHAPDWHNATCTPNIVSGTPSLEATKTPTCPIAGTGMDAETPAIDTTNETSGPPGEIDINGTLGYPAAKTVGKTIADQLNEHGMSWKAYEESVPATGADNVNYSDGAWSNLSVFTAAQQAMGQTNANIVPLYQAKHNPFAYFASIQATAVNGQIPGIVGFDGATGLYADLASGHAPNFAWIAPNHCNDMHGTGNGGPFCAYDPNDNGTQTGLNPALVAQGDLAVQKIVTAIKASPVWASRERSAIVIIWDENDYSVAPTNNRVVAIVDKNYGVQTSQSTHFYTHFSLLRSIEAGLRLPCLNHACDSTTRVMSDLFR